MVAGPPGDCPNQGTLSLPQKFLSSQVQHLKPWMGSLFPSGFPSPRSYTDRLADNPRVCRTRLCPHSGLSGTVCTLVFLWTPSLWMLAFCFSGPRAPDREVRPFKLKQPFPCRKWAWVRLRWAPPWGGPSPPAPGGAVQSGHFPSELLTPFAGCRVLPAPCT